MELFNNEELQKLFIRYALKEGSSTLLSNEGLQGLLRNHFSSFLGSLTLSEIAKCADMDKDGKINFNDFKALLSKFTVSGVLSGLTGLGS